MTLRAQPAVRDETCSVALQRCIAEVGMKEAPLGGHDSSSVRLRIPFVAIHPPSTSKNGAHCFGTSFYGGRHLEDLSLSSCLNRLFLPESPGFLDESVAVAKRILSTRKAGEHTRWTVQKAQVCADGFRHSALAVHSRSGLKVRVPPRIMRNMSTLVPPPRLMIIFHHFPSFSIIFHHFPMKIALCGIPHFGQSQMYGKKL